MAAASFLHKRATVSGETGPEPTRLTRDLMQIAELVELCFGDRLDASGRSAIREMKTLARIWPLLWIISLLDKSGFGLGMGYVWRDKGRVVGNVSLYRGSKHPQLGPGWLVANVAVHPDYRRQGIARTLMDKTLDLANQHDGQWVVLQVETDNEAAIELYRGMGFDEYEVLDHWQTTRILKPAPAAFNTAWSARPRKRGEAAQEADLIYNRARRGAMAWTRTIERQDIDSPLFSLRAGLNGSSDREHWVLPALHRHNALRGALWIDTSGWQSTRLSHFLDPALEDPAARQLLLRKVLQHSRLQGRKVRVETTGDDPPVADLLSGAGFRNVRSLLQMRKQLNS